MPSSAALERTLRFSGFWLTPSTRSTMASKVFVAVNQNINGFQDVPVLFSAIVPAAS